MNPDYDDRRLDYILGLKEGEVYLKTLQFVDIEAPIKRLKDFFSKKGNNVVCIKNKSLFNERFY